MVVAREYAPLKRRRNRVKQLFRLARSYLSYRLGRQDNVPPPFRLWIEPTNRCNLKCVMCPTGMAPKGHVTGMMELDRYRKIIDEVAPFVFDVNLHHRGESLLHPEIVPMIEYAAERGLYTNLHTNGTIMTEDLAQRLTRSGLDILSFSFDAIEPAEYSKIRVGGKYEKVLENIRLFLSCRSEIGSKRPHATVEAIDFDPGSSPSSRRDASEKMEGLFRQHPPDVVRIKAPHNWAGEYDAPTDGRDGSTYTPCLFLWYSLTILYDGSLVVCPQDMGGSIKVGEAGSDQVLSSWNGETLRELRDRMVKGQVDDLSPCNSCDRLRRNRVAGIPREELGRFLRENLFR